MVSLSVGLLLLCVCAPLFRPVNTAPVQEEDEDNGRSFKRELELFVNEVQDGWELDDNEYLSKRELQEAKDQEKNSDKNLNEHDAEEDRKRWLDVDTPGNGASEEKLSPALEDDLPKNGAIFQGDIVMDDYVRDVFNGEAQKRDAVSLPQYRWPDATVYYKFDRNIDFMSKIVIKRAIRQYRLYTCIKFKKKIRGDRVRNYVNFISNGSACYSNVGRRSGGQDVSIGSGCLRLGTPIHEMMHVLGFFHEMARPDRDKAVDIHWDNIQERLKHNFKKIPIALDKPLIPFNYDSVMEYSNYAFSNNGEKTITAKNDPEKEFGQRCGFSVGDVWQINVLYNCPHKNLRFRGVSYGKTLCP